ncbi:hypothetical protein [Pseudarthrobacter sp. DSP2-3-2b1]|uniref:hypothetical protein n=1 Tax=Pseudarthrobacter sp. DSP2-3-2b1 TaxID=2804661 RepID=UPI003CE79651
MDRKTLKEDGFAGFRTLGSLEIMRVPQGTGLFAVLRPNEYEPHFLKKSTAGIFKKKDPSLPPEPLLAEWVDGADILYIGKAGPGSKGNRGLRRQIQEFLDFGQGKPPGHWDGRLIWQLTHTDALIIAWKELPAEELNNAEARYHAEFVEAYGKLPFANLVQARTKDQRPETGIPN